MYLVYVSHQGRFGQPRTIWRRGRLQKAATTRDRCIVHMCASSVLTRRATSPTPAQQKLPLFFNPIQMGPRKTNLVFRRSPDRRGIILKSSKKTEKIYDFFAFFSTCMPAEYWYHVCHTCMCRHSIPPV